MIPAREVLTVIADGEFRSGVIAYGLRQSARTETPLFPHSAWPDGTSVEEYVLRGENWQVIRWDIEISSWPVGEAWEQVVKRTLSALLEAEAVVAWLGQEGVFSDPPDLFKPEYMTGGVLGAMTDSGELVLSMKPDEPLRSLTDSQLLQLRVASKGLSDAR